MRKIRMHVYPEAKLPDLRTTEEWPEYADTLPFNKKSIAQHIECVEPRDAEFFYMGAIRNDDVSEEGFRLERFPYLTECPERHIANIDGDWDHREREPTLDPVFRKCILIMSSHNRSMYPNAMVRPCCGPLLHHLLKQFPIFPFPPERAVFGFCGGILNHWSRLVLLGWIKKNQIPSVTLPQIGGRGASGIFPGSSEAMLYELNMRDCGLALCPRGSGEHSIRFYEACFFMCVPILIGDCGVVGDDYYDTRFIWQISPLASEYDTMQFLHHIIKEPLDKMRARAVAARIYFDNVVRVYFKDPTAYFLRWMVRHRYLREEL